MKTNLHCCNYIFIYYNKVNYIAIFTAVNLPILTITIFVLHSLDLVSCKSVRWFIFLFLYSFYFTYIIIGIRNVHLLYLSVLKYINNNLPICLILKVR